MSWPGGRAATVPRFAVWGQRGERRTEGHRAAHLSAIDCMSHSQTTRNDPSIASWAANTFPREAKSPQEQPKTASRRPKSAPRPSKEGPRAPQSGPRPPQDGPRPPPGALLGRSWSHLGTNQPQHRKPDRPGSLHVKKCKLLGPILEPKTTPKTTPRRPQNETKIKTKNASALGPVLDRS